MEVVVLAMLAFSAGVSLGFTGGRVFERIQWDKKGWKKIPGEDNGLD